MKIYKSLDNQTIFDICLSIYGTLDKLTNLMVNNNLNLIDYISSGTTILYEDNITNIPKSYATNNNVYQTPIYSPTPFRNTYYPNLSVGTASLISLVSGIDATNSGFNDHHDNPLLDRKVDISLGYENTGGQTNARLINLNDRIGLYFGYSETRADSNLGLIGSPNEIGVYHMDNSYSNYDFGTSSSLTVGCLFRINGTFSYIGVPGGGLLEPNKFTITALRSDYYTGGDVYGCRIFYKNNGSNNPILGIESNGNDGLNTIISDDLVYGEVYALVVVFDKTLPGVNQIKARIKNLSYRNLRNTFNNIDVAENTDYFENNIYSPSIGAVGGFPYPAVDGGDVTIGTLAYYKGALNLGDQAKLMTWMMNEYNFF